VDVARGPDVLFQRIGVAVLTDLQDLAGVVVVVVERLRRVSGVRAEEFLDPPARGVVAVRGDDRAGAAASVGPDQRDPVRRIVCEFAPCALIAIV